MKILNIVLITCLFSSCISLDIMSMMKYSMNSPIHSIPKYKGIYVLTSETIDEAIKNIPNLWILFHAPWCPHCQDFIPALRKAVKTNKLKVLGLNFAQIDIDFYKDIATRFDIKGMPTMLSFKPNGDRDETYQGGESKNQIIEWFYKKKVGPYHEITEEKQIQKLMKTKKESKLVYYGDNPENIKIFSNYSNFRGSMYFGVCDDKELMKKYNIKEDSVYIYKPFDDPNYDITTNITFEGLNEMLRLNSQPIIQMDGLYTLEMSLYTRQPVFCFIAPTNKPENYKKYLNTLRELGIEFRNKGLKFTMFNTSDRVAQNIMKISNVTGWEKLNDDSQPLAIIWDYYKDFNKWKLLDYFKEYTYENMRQFTQNFLDRKYKPDPRSEEIPKDNDGKLIRKIVLNNFKDEVINNKKNVIVKFYSPTCPHCIKLKPIYEDVAKNYEGRKDVVFGEIDMTENDYEDIPIHGYPTVILFPARNKTDHVVFEGERTVEVMTAFIENNI